MGQTPVARANKTMPYRTITMFLSILSACLMSHPAPAQSTIATGSIQGTVTDPSGAAIPQAAVRITGAATGQSLGTITSSSGAYHSGALVPGEYKVRIEAAGMRSYELTLPVLVGVTANGDARMALGAKTEVVEVSASAATVNTGQATVQGVVTAAQIDSLPINGRNFLDLAQLEPGVQIQDGRNFDPTKMGYSSISFGGRFGRNARISVDGLDISDETVGTATQGIPSSGIQEFQLSQSNLDLSTDLTSSGAVNVVTRSGTNAYHGETFYLIRDSRWGAAVPHPEGLDAPYQRNQFGGRLGGALIGNRLFFFLDFERTKQDSVVPVQYAGAFSKLSGGFGSPFRENMPMARLDWQATPGMRLFYRFNYFANMAESTWGAVSYQVLRNKNYARTHVAGADFSSGQFTHAIRFQNMKFENSVAEAVTGTSLPLANLGIALLVASGPRTGPPAASPQTTLQLNRQIKYDGGRPIHAHFLRFGVNYNYIVTGGLAAFLLSGPGVRTNLKLGDAEKAAAGPFPGGAGNPLNYPVETVLVGNGQGYFTEKPGLGYPAGKVGPDHRFAVYVGDSWKARKDLTITFGLRYNRDTGRTSSDLGSAAPLDALFPGAGAPARQPNLDLAPQVGVAWAPGRGKTAFRAGAGLFYENTIFLFAANDRTMRLPTGSFLQTPQVCGNGRPFPVEIPGGSLTIPAELCKLTVGEAAAGIASFARLYQSKIPFNLSAPNPNYLGTQLADGYSLYPGLLAPEYQTARAFQFNGGVERELAKGMVLSVDYRRNVTTHSLLAIDINRVGDVRYFNKSAASAAIRETLNAFGAGSIDEAIKRGATMADFASFGLNSPGLDGGLCPYDYGCAFPGMNPKAPAIYQFKPIGRTVYNGLDIKLRESAVTRWRMLRRADFQAAYSLSRYVNPGGTNPTLPLASDQDVGVQALDNANPLAFMGPSLLDRTHQFSFGGFFLLAHSLRVSMISHFRSGIPVSAVTPTTNLGSGEIFATDFTGDGSVGDLLPSSRVGSFNRDWGPAGLRNAIDQYNKTVANQPTPAGKVLVENALFTVAQLRALGGVAPTVPAPPVDQAGIGGLRALDLALSWSHTVRERIVFEPRIDFFNLLNLTNFDLPPNVLSGLLNGGSGTINGTPNASRVSNRVGVGTGVFALGSPRAIEFGMRISF